MLPVVVLEGRGPLGAIRRADQLARGGRTRVAIMALVAFILVYLPAIGVGLLLGMGPELLGEPVGTVSTARTFTYEAVKFLVGLVTTPFLIAVMVRAY